MIRDARALPSQQNIIETDVCIVGAGPAALVIARELCSVGMRLTLLESGGVDFDALVQELNAGQVVGDSYDDLRQVRNRRIGGSVNIWNTDIDGSAAAKYVPLDPIDFEEREWLEHSGWSLGYEELEPWYTRAQTICGLGPFAYEGSAWAEPARQPLDLGSGPLESRVYQLGTSGALLAPLVSAFGAQDRLELLHHATVTELLAKQRPDRVSAVAVSVPGRSGRVYVHAHTFILAAGAIENARLLLLSGAGRHHRLGNEHELVGRFFMEHPRDYALTLIPARPSFFMDAAFYDQHSSNGGTVIMGRLAVTASALRAHRSLQASATLLPAAARAPLRECIARRLRLQHGRTDYPRAGAGWSQRHGATSAFKRVRLLLNLEQAPHARNRIVLGRERDPFGCCRAELDWRWSDGEQRALDRTRRLFADALESGGYGRVEIAAQLRPDPNAHHHAGTTRMHDDPRLGVVDSNCRVHGVDNLYVAGASVFPTAGFANPTLTIVALSARLADHLRTRAISGSRSCTTATSPCSSTTPEGAGDHVGG